MPTLLEKALKEEVHTHLLFRSWKRGEARVSLRCATCPHVEYEEATLNEQSN